MISYKFRLYPTKSQKAKLLRSFDLCRNLYNCALQERNSFYKIFHKFRSYEDQCKTLLEIKEDLPEYKEIHSQVLQSTLKTLKKAFDNFFRRVKQGEKPGFPRFKSWKGNQSITFPQSGF